MSRTNSLRKLLTKMLKTVCENVYYEVADEEKMYPHIVFSISSIDLGNMERKDYIAEIEIWDKSMSAVKTEELKDKVEDLFNAENAPQDDILPTFFLVNSKKVNDDDKEIRHRLVEVQIQNYER